METVVFKDLGRMNYQEAWNYQESLLQGNVRIKTAVRQAAEVVAGDGGAGAVAGVHGAVGGDTTMIRGAEPSAGAGERPDVAEVGRETTNYLLFGGHPPVYTLGKGGQ